MAAAKLASKRNRRRTALRVLGLAGVSLSLAGGASASTSGSATDITYSRKTNSSALMGDSSVVAVLSPSTIFVTNFLIWAVVMSTHPGNAWTGIGLMNHLVRRTRAC